MTMVRRLAVNNQMKSKLASCLVLRNEVISIGFNSDKSHPIQKKFSRNSESIFKHAEIDCIINALKHIEKDELQKATLYIYRVKKQNKEDRSWVDGLSKPCNGCCKAIEHFGIKKVVFSTDENGIYNSYI